MGTRIDCNVPRPHRRVDIRTRLEAKAIYCGDCIVWSGYISKDGYGKIGLGGKKNGVSPTGLVHRVAYELYKGPIPEGMEVDHLCKNRPCINPAHLEAVLKIENIRRAFANWVSSPHCKNGHIRTEQNTYTKRGWSECLQCTWEKREVTYRKI